MPCHTALLKNVLQVKPDEKVEVILPKLSGNVDQYAVVIDDEGVLVGYISHRVILKNLLPVSVAAHDGLDLNVTVNAAPGTAKRLKAIKPLAVSEIMQRKFTALHPETPTWEGVNALVKYNEPVFVVEPGTNKYIGVMNEHSVLEDFERMNSED